MVRIIGHSDKKLPSEIRAALENGEIPSTFELGKQDFKGKSAAYHAEQMVLMEAEKLGIKIQKIEVAGQAVCKSCVDALDAKGIKFESPRQK